jgi:RND family efflux transporter MFP subunit
LQVTWHWLLTGVPLVGLICVAGCGPKAAPNKEPASGLPAAAVRVQTVESVAETASEEVMGTIRARLSATLEAKLNGRIEELPVTLGQRVKAGDLLIRLDAPEITARLEQANAAFEQTERDWRRVSGLYEQQAATRAEYDAADVRRRVAKAAVEEAKAMMGYAKILAPFDGVVTRKYADQGDQAIPGKPLVAMEIPSALELEADVPEGIAANLRLDAQLACKVNGPNGEVMGRVSEIAPAADPASRTLKVKLQLPELAGLRAGQFARLAVPLGESRSLRAPAQAIVQRGELDLVFKVVNQHAQMQLVKTGRQFGNEMEILAGLEPGDVVVVDGATQLSDGQAVEAK